MQFAATVAAKAVLYVKCHADIDIIWKPGLLI